MKKELLVINKTSGSTTGDYFSYLKRNKNKILNENEWVKHYWSREATFANYPRECNLPSSILAEYGFYYDALKKVLKCSECSFEFSDINTDSFDEILNKHSTSNSECINVKLSLELSMKLTIRSNFDVPESDKNALVNKSISFNELTTKSHTKRLKTTNMSEEMRLKSFENIKLLLDTKMLASNGFYKVQTDQFTLPPFSQNTSNRISQDINKMNSDDVKLMAVDQDDDISRPNELFKNEPTQIESIASSLGALIYIKCAFCSYECLLFKNSHLNTMFKSPFEEHREKSFNTCPIFTKNDNEISASFPPHVSDFKMSKLAKYEENLKWLQYLYDFEMQSMSAPLPITNNLSSASKDSLLNSLNTKNAFEMLTNANNYATLDDVEVRQMPKILDHLVMAYMNNKTSSGANALLKSSTNQSSDSGAIVYVPNSGSNSGTLTTSDFDKLQNVLNMSDRVISGKAYHTAYTSYQTRLDTFKEWPATLSQQPIDLARAGFYYFGIKDMVKCFFCNGGLKNWDHNDDPYQDHVRWFPKCQFIRQLMGAEYVEKVREKYKNKDSGFTEDYNVSQSNNTDLNSNSSSSNKSTSNSSDMNRMKRSVSPRTLNSRLDCFIVRKIVDTNLITRDAIKQAIEIKLSSHNQTPVTGNYGDDFKTPIELAKLSYDLDKKKTEKVELFNSLSNILIANLPNNLSSDSIRQLIFIKYGAYPSSIKLIKEQGSKNRCFALICFKQEIISVIDTIESSLSGKKFPVKLSTEETGPLLQVVKTNWNEIEDKIKPLFDKSQIFSSSVTSLSHNNLNKESLLNQTSFKVNPDANTQVTSKPLLNNEQSEKPILNHEQSNLVQKKEETTVDTIQLKEENERLKNERLCVVCMDKTKNIIFLPCAHLAACLDCSFSLQHCPMCRTKIQATVKTFT